MKAEQVVEHIQQIWAENPLPEGTAILAVTTIEGIEQQLALGPKCVHYLSLENGKLHLRLVKVTE